MLHLGAGKRRDGLRRAEQWPWSSLHTRTTGQENLPPLDDWPVDRPADWLAVVNSAAKTDALEALRTSVVRGRPFGSVSWVQRTAERLGLQFTLRPRGKSAGNRNVLSATWGVQRRSRTFPLGCLSVIRAGG